MILAAGSGCALGRPYSLRGAGAGGRDLLQELDRREESCSHTWGKWRRRDVCLADSEALSSMPHDSDMQLVER